MNSIYVDFVGDSLTVGFPGVDGFRPGVNSNLLARSLSKSILYTGKQVSGSSITNFYDAIFGTTVNSWDARFSVRPAKDIKVCFRILLGTNDADGTAPTTYASNMQTLLADIQANYPISCVSLALLPPKQGAANIAAMNALLPGVVATALGLGQKIILEADAGCVFPADFQGDGIHLSASGNTKEVVVASNGIIAACTLAGFLP